MLGISPLCPAGHLPLKGGDRTFAPPCHKLRSDGTWEERFVPISPLEGEMPGRAEGGM
ncbi:lytic murein transglycosylase [Agrobacterium cavarae]|uniref:Lytic murein transglycosylase n=1 Tax=Agrobacterium cavarae TaxID=2528239 RepID=A0ABY1Y776_9HYPH|nr:lytic murein transglycosylase [Agrobacterium cavarae]